MMKDKSYFIRSDIETYKKKIKFMLLCEPCKEIGVKKVEKQESHKQQIKIEKYEE